jgi:hypothetical protein
LVLFLNETRWSKAFQNMVISKKAGREIYGDPMVKKYITDLQKAIGSDTAKQGQSFWRKIPNTPAGKLLVGRSVYGPKYNGGSRFSRDSVHCIGQGTPQLNKSSDGVYKLTFSESTHTAKEINWAFGNDEYRAVFASTFRNDRKTEVDGATVKNMRSGIYPYDFVYENDCLNIYCTKVFRKLSDVKSAGDSLQPF